MKARITGIRWGNETGTNEIKGLDIDITPENDEEQVLLDLIKRTKGFTIEVGVAGLVLSDKVA